MRVAHFSTFPHGGAAGAALRQHRSLIRMGVDSQFYYHRNQRASSLVELGLGPLASTCHRLDFSTSEVPSASGVLHRVTDALSRRREKRRLRRIYDQYNRHLAVRPVEGETFAMAELPVQTPLDWSTLQADIVHLHWVSYFLDYPSFFNSIPDDIPIVWTLHDTHAFTGGCHYNNGCARYRFGCGSCPQVDHASPTDVSRSTWDAKRLALANKQVHVTAPCDWMLDMARQSALWPDSTSFEKLEYGLELEHFYPVDPLEARRELGLPEQGTLIALGAMDLQNPRKGFQYLTQALEQLAAEGISGDKGELACVVFGDGDLQSSRPLPRLHKLGFLDSRQQQRLVYSASDLVVVPSIEDNQPQVGLEAMACGTPVIAFNATGLPEYVHHEQTGLLARAGSSDDLAAQLRRAVGDPGQRKAWGQNAKELVKSRFEWRQQTTKLISAYQRLAAFDGAAPRRLGRKAA